MIVHVLPLTTQCTMGSVSAAACALVRVIQSCNCCWRVQQLNNTLCKGACIKRTVVRMRYMVLCYPPWQQYVGVGDRQYLGDGTLADDDLILWHSCAGATSHPKYPPCVGHVEYHS
jgi:hypothetical protein